MDGPYCATTAPLSSDTSYRDRLGHQISLRVLVSWGLSDFVSTDPSRLPWNTENQMWSHLNNPAYQMALGDVRSSPRSGGNSAEDDPGNKVISPIRPSARRTAADEAPAAAGSLPAAAPPDMQPPQRSERSLLKSKKTTTLCASWLRTTSTRHYCPEQLSPPFCEAKLLDLGTHLGADEGAVRDAVRGVATVSLPGSASHSNGLRRVRQSAPCQNAMG